MLAKLYTHWEHGVEVGKEEKLEKGCAKCWDMVSLIISWGEMLGVWHSCNHSKENRYHCWQYQWIKAGEGKLLFQLNVDSDVKIMSINWLLPSSDQMFEIILHYIMDESLSVIYKITCYGVWAQYLWHRRSLFSWFSSGRKNVASVSSRGRNSSSFL